MITTTDEPFVPTQPATIALLKAVDKCCQRPTPPQPGPSREEQLDNFYLHLGTTREEALELYNGSITRSEESTSEIVKGSDKPSQETPDQTEQRYQRWLTAVRNGKYRQKYDTCSRKKDRQQEREREASRTGGSVRISKTGRKTVLCREVREMRARSMDLINKNRLADKRPATVNLPLKDKTRSRAEGDLMEFTLGQLFPDLDMLYSETRPDRVSEVGCTWRGNLFPWERDFDCRVKSWQSDLFPEMASPEFQIACKGTGFWYILLCRAVKDTGLAIPHYQPKALENLFRILATLAIRSIINEIQGICETDDHRQLLFCSAKSVRTWVKSGHRYSRRCDLLDLFCREDMRFRRYFWKFFKTVFPREVAILRRAEAGLRAELASLGNPKLTAEQVAEGFAIYLAAAKAEDSYTDDRAQLALRYRQLRFDSKTRKQVLKDLPSWFRPTPVTPVEAKRDTKGRFTRIRR